MRGIHALAYRPELDGLRGVAVLSVLAYHAVPHVPGGFLGVDAFFVLSGYLITTLLLDEHAGHGSIALGRFYARRALRLLPAMFACLIAYLLVTGFAMPSVWRAAAVAAYVPNWARIHGLSLGPLGHTWSLGIEEQFYLLWPPLLTLYAPIPRVWLLLGAVACIDVAAWRRVALWSSEGLVRVYNGLDTRIDGLMLGAAVAIALSLAGARAFTRLRSSRSRSSPSRHSPCPGTRPGSTTASGSRSPSWWRSCFSSSTSTRVASSDAGSSGAR